MKKFYYLPIYFIALNLISPTLVLSDLNSNNQEPLGTVKIVIIKYNDVFSDDKDNKSPYSLSLVSSENKRIMKHVARRDYQTKNNLGMIYDYYLDEYEIMAPAGLYRVVIDKWDFEFANFRLSPHIVKKFEFSDNILIKSVCKKKERIAEIYSAEEGLKAGRERYNSKPYHALRKENIALPNSLNFIINYCEKKVKKQRIVYYGVLGSYLGEVIDARKVVLDKKKKRLTFHGTRKYPIVLTIEGPDYGIIEFNLVKGKIVRTEKFTDK